MDFNLIAIPAGNYSIGSELLAVSRPVHVVRLEAYFIMDTAVTNAQYAEFLKAGAYDKESYWTKLGWRWRKAKGSSLPAFWGDTHFAAPDQPLVGIAWYEALAFTNWLAAETGENWRLPSEVHWEAAAQGEGTGKIHTAENGRDYTLPVNQGYRSANGAWNLLGNVWEWCSTQWGHNWQSLDFPYPYNPDDGRENLEDSGARIMRGGSWFDTLEEAHPAQRARYLPGSRGSNIGFRLVKLAPVMRTSKALRSTKNTNFVSPELESFLEAHFEGLEQQQAQNENISAQERGQIALKIGGRLQLFAEEKNLGRTFIEMSYRLSNADETVYTPYLSYIANPNAEISKDSPTIGLPDFLIEVQSHSDSIRELHEKAEFYVANGVSLVWLIYPRQKIIEVFRKGGDIEIANSGDSLNASPIVPDFVLTVDYIFKDIE